jgi:hypothetical protein
LVGAATFGFTCVHFSAPPPYDQEKNLGLGLILAFVSIPIAVVWAWYLAVWGIHRAFHSSPRHRS